MDAFNITPFHLRNSWVEDYYTLETGLTGKYISHPLITKLRETGLPFISYYGDIKIPRTLTEEQFMIMENICVEYRLTL